MKGQIILCISTFTVLLASVNCQFPGQYPAPGQFSPYDAQGYGGGGFGGDTQQVDPFLALRLKNLKKLNKLSVGLDQGLSKALALKSKCSKLLSQQLKNSLLPPQELTFPGSPFSGLPCPSLLNSQQQLLNIPPQLLSSQAQNLNFPPQLLGQPQGLNIPPQLLGQPQGLNPSQLFGQPQGFNLPPQLLGQGQQPQGFNLPQQFLQPQSFNLPPQLCNAQQDAFPGGQVQLQQASPQDYQIPLELIQRMSSDPISAGQPITHRVINISGPCPHQGFPQDAQQYGAIGFPQTSQSTSSVGNPQVNGPDYGQFQYGQSNGQPQYGQSDYEKPDYGQLEYNQPQTQQPAHQKNPIQFPGRSYQQEQYYEQ